MSSNSIVLDIGTDLTKGGFGLFHAPSVIIPTVSGCQKKSILSKREIKGKSFHPIYFGNEAIVRKTLLDLSYPITRSSISNWDSFEYFLDYLFCKELNISLDHDALLVTETPKNPLNQREKLAEILFESWNFEKINFSMQTILSLYANGRTDGIVINIGEGSTQIMPIFEGYILSDGVSRIDLAGYDISMRLKKILNNKGIVLCDRVDYELIKEIKNKTCIVDLSKYNGKLTKKVEYFLPDGQSFILTPSEQSEASELLFDPENYGCDMIGIQKLINQSVLNCDIHIRRQLYANMILSGGTTMIDKFPQRLGKELQDLVPNGTKMNILANPDRNKSSWIGGSILASLSTCNWLLKSSYSEKGSNILKSFFT